MVGCIAALVLMLLAFPAIAGETIPPEETQAGMNQAAGKRLEAAEAEMARVLSKLLQEAAGKREAISKLNKAQAAWAAYRDAQLEVLWPFPDRTWYGTVYPMCFATVKEQMTRARTKELRTMLMPHENDACAPGWPE